jgi:carbon storage regulator CsrA
LSRKQDESLILTIGETTIEVTITEIRQGQCRIGIEAPRSVRIDRKEKMRPIERAALKG